MLVAYFDESVTHSPQDVFCVAGYVSTVRHWRKFSELWVHTLRNQGFDEFHMTDFEGRHPPFDRLTNTRRLALQRRLLSLVKRFAIAGVAEGLPLIEFQQLVVEPISRRLAEAGHTATAFEYRDPYLNCFLACLARIVEFQQSGRLPSGKIACVLHRNEASRGRITRMFDSLVQDGFFPDVYGSLSFASAREAVPLQAADVLAYESMKMIKNGLVGPEFREPRKSGQVLAAVPNLYGGFYHPGLLAELGQSTIAAMNAIERGEPLPKP